MHLKFDSKHLQLPVLLGADPGDLRVHGRSSPRSSFFAPPEPADPPQLTIGGDQCSPTLSARHRPPTRGAVQGPSRGVAARRVPRRRLRLHGSRRSARSAVPAGRAGRQPPAGGVLRRLRSACCWFAADWPMHDIGEGYLYSVHMFQHMMLSYFVPPLVLMATPDVDGTSADRRWPHLSGVPLLQHAGRRRRDLQHGGDGAARPGLVNASTENGPLHYGLHLLVVTTALLMWMPGRRPVRGAADQPPAASASTCS